MKYLSTRKNNEQISFREAVINGLTNNGGLYVPEDLPSIPADFFNNIETYEDLDIAFTVLKPFVKDSLNDSQLKNILSETLNFDIPVVSVEENISCLEVESALYKHAQVSEACVFSLPDERLGEVVGAVVYVENNNPEVVEQALQAFVAEHLAKFKIPSKVWIIAQSLPRLGSGKIDKRSIKEQYQALYSSNV